MPRRQAATLLICLTIVAAVPAAQEKPSTPPVSLFATRSVLRVPAGAVEAAAEILIHAVGAGVAGRPGAPTLTDQPPQGATIVVAFGQPIEVQDGRPDLRVWRIPVQIKGVPTAPTTSLRIAVAEWGYVKATIEYWISNAAAPVLNWKVTGLPSEWRVTDRVCHPLRIAATGARATGIKVTSTLVEPSTKSSLPGLFLSVDETNPADPARLEAEVNEGSKGISLCTPGGIAPGKYQGTVNVSAAEKPEGDPLTATVYATNNPARALGALLLAAGCVFAYVFRVLTPARIHQAQALLPAALLREQGTEFRTRLGDANAQQTKGALTELINSLETRSLISKNLVPSGVAMAFGGAPEAARYKLFLDEAAALLARLIVIVEGFETARRLGILAQASPALDAIASEAQALTVAEVRLRVKSALQPSMPSGAPVPTVEEPGSQQLVVQIERLNAGVWLAWTTLAFLVGFVTLVLNQPGFGVPLDYLYCVLWGFGVPTAGQQLSGATAGTALGVTLPGPRP